MLETVKKVVQKDEIEMEETKVIKMLVPMAFTVTDGKCEDEETQALYDFLTTRDDVIKDEDSFDREAVIKEFDGETTQDEYNDGIDLNNTEVQTYSYDA